MPGEHPTEAMTLTTPTTHTIFLPLVSRQPPMQITGLAFLSPNGWTREVGTQTPPTNTQIADADFVRFLSPDGTYRLEANSDWATAPQPPFGNLAIPVDPFIASLYEESVTTLADGTTLVQVLRAKNDWRMPGKRSRISYQPCNPIPRMSPRLPAWSPM